MSPSVVARRGKRPLSSCVARTRHMLLMLPCEKAKCQGRCRQAHACADEVTAECRVQSQNDAKDSSTWQAYNGESSSGGCDGPARCIGHSPHSLLSSVVLCSVCTTLCGVPKCDDCRIWVLLRSEPQTTIGYCHGLRLGCPRCLMDVNSSHDSQTETCERPGLRDHSVLAESDARRLADPPPRSMGESRSSWPFHVLPSLGARAFLVPPCTSGLGSTRSLSSGPARSPARSRTSPIWSRSVHCYL